MAFDGSEGARVHIDNIDTVVRNTLFWTRIIIQLILYTRTEHFGCWHTIINFHHAVVVGGGVGVAAVFGGVAAVDNAHAVVVVANDARGRRSH